MSDRRRINYDSRQSVDNNGYPLALEDSFFLFSATCGGTADNSLRCMRMPKMRRINSIVSACITVVIGLGIHVCTAVVIYCKQDEFGKLSWLRGYAGKVRSYPWQSIDARYGMPCMQEGECDEFIILVLTVVLFGLNCKTDTSETRYSGRSRSACMDLAVNPRPTLLVGYVVVLYPGLHKLMPAINISSALCWCHAASAAHERAAGLAHASLSGACAF